MKTGIQVSSFKPVLTNEAEVKAAFAHIKAMGCRWVQLQWIDPCVPTDMIAACLKENRIASVSVQDFYEVIRQNKSYYIDLNVKTGGTWMCVSRIPERLKTRAGLDDYVAELRAFQQELDAYGQKLCFHAVAADFAPIEGINPVEYLFEAMPELFICLDLYHVNKVGQDMKEWLERYAGRICMVHFKDKVGHGETEKLVPAGQGDTDWTGVVEVCAQTGVDYGFVEQERWDKDPFVSLHEALDWLNGQQLRFVTETIRIPGLKRSYTFYHTSDCHLAHALPEEGAEALATAEQAAHNWGYMGVRPVKAFEQILKRADEDGVDGLFLCGDVADYWSEGTLKAVRERFAQTKTELFYVCGNHERARAEEGRGFYSHYTDLMHGTPGFWVREFDEFMIVGIDDGDQQMRKEELDLLEKQFAKGKPMLVLIHIPILTPGSMVDVKKKWGENGPDYFLLGKPTDTELSRRFCQMLADPAAPIVAVMAGHIHTMHQGEIIPGRMQYTSGPAFESVVRKYVLIPE